MIFLLLLIKHYSPNKKRLFIYFWFKEVASFEYSVKWIIESQYVTVQCCWH